MKFWRCFQEHLVLKLFLGVLQLLIITQVVTVAILDVSKKFKSKFYGLTPVNYRETCTRYKLVTKTVNRNVENRERGTPNLTDCAIYF